MDTDTAKRADAAIAALVAETAKISGRPIWGLCVQVGAVGAAAAVIARLLA